MTSTDFILAAHVGYKSTLFAGNTRAIGCLGIGRNWIRMDQLCRCSAAMRRQVPDMKALISKTNIRSRGSEKKLEVKLTVQIQLRSYP